MGVEQDRELLRAAEAKGRLATLGAYARLSGPGWLQSAITLGGGSLASSLYLGVLAGFSMLWLQPLAMILGIIMLGAIGYVTLSTGQRPFRAINEHVNPVLGWAWALASLVASMVWCLPQFSLATGVLQQNLLPNVFGSGSSLDDFTAKLILVVLILVATVLVTWCYDSKGFGIRLYEILLKVLVAAIVLCFGGVVLRMSFAEGGLDWSAILAGFVPDPSLLTRPAAGFDQLLAGVPEAYRSFWENRIVQEQRQVMISAAATAVGINMTFLLPYTLLRRGWTREFRGLLLFDLGTGMFIPFVLATSCVILAAAHQFHPRPDRALTAPPALAEKAAADLQQERLRAKLGTAAYSKLTEGQRTAMVEPIAPAERGLVHALKRRDAIDLARSLEALTGREVANLVFGLGVLGMTLSTITILMLISGMVICEIFDLPQEGWPHRLACLAGATGALGPFVWQGARFYLAVPTSVFGMTLLPIAYLTFFLLMNQRSLLGDALPRGGRRLAWNLLMALAAGIATCASLWIIVQEGGTIGIAGAGGLLVLALAVHFLRRRPGA